MSAEVESWVKELHANILARSRVEDAKPTSKGSWSSTNMSSRAGTVQVADTQFQIGRNLVDAAYYGYVSLDPVVSLPDDGTVDEIKDSIFGIMQDCLAARAQSVRDTLRSYQIECTQFKADFLLATLKVTAVTARPVMQANTIMSNKTVREAMRGNVVIELHTQVEEDRRTDQHEKPRPEHQFITRTFHYVDRVLTRNDPDHWSAGMSYNDGDVIGIGSLRWTVGSDPFAGWNIPNRPEARIDLSPGERAYQQAARNR